MKIHENFIIETNLKLLYDVPDEYEDIQRLLSRPRPAGMKAMSG
jgi:hypothetical protein